MARKEIGAVIARGLAQYGAKVAIAARDWSMLEEVAKDIQTKVGAEVAAFKFDTTDEKSIAHLVEQAVSRFGTADILVSSQGANIKGPADEFPITDWELMFDVNVKGTMLASREFAKVMIPKKSGEIINLASVRGVLAIKYGDSTGYCATKGAVNIITRALASEWAPYHINVNVIAPSLVQPRGTEALFKDRAKIQKHRKATRWGGWLLPMI